ncbi:aspartic peptidase domain-containing protein [Chytridium lagenaria]|nr:aspartic peptidase domain-containing protein [Chytridium lagenaria]
MMAPLRLSTIMVMTAWTLCLQSAQVAASIFDIQLQKASSTPLGEEDFGLIKHRSLASLIADDVAYLNFKYGNGDTFTVGAIGATVLDVINNRDRGYFVQVEIGSPPQRFNVVIDTGSSTLWVGASECGGNCNSANYFDNRASSTYAVAPRFRGAIGTISYGSGTITGRLVTDQVNLGNLNIRNQTFVEVTSQSSQLQRILNGQWDGILGLSYDGGPSAVNDYYGVFYSLVQTRAVTESVFCVWLNGSVDGQTYYTNGGRLVFGGIESSLYSGGITWMPLSHGSNAKRPYWSVTGRSISIGSNSIGAPSNTLVVVDSGTALMAFDDNTYQNIINAFRGTGLSLSCSSSNICTFDCGVARSLPTVTLNLNGNDFSLDPTDYVFYDRSSNVCSLGIQTVLASIGSGSDVYWIVGDVFLRKYMSFYDYGNSAVGLALSANRSPASLPPSLSGGSGGGSGGGTSSDGTGTGNGGGGSSPTSGGGSSSNNNNGGSGTTGSPGSGTGSGSSPAGTNGSSSGGGTSSSNNNSGGGASSNGGSSSSPGSGSSGGGSSLLLLLPLMEPRARRRAGLR